MNGPGGSTAIVPRYGAEISRFPSATWASVYQTIADSMIRLLSPSANVTPPAAGDFRFVEPQSRWMELIHHQQGLRFIYRIRRHNLRSGNSSRPVRGTHCIAAGGTSHTQCSQWVPRRRWSIIRAVKMHRQCNATRNTQALVKQPQERKSTTRLRFRSVSFATDLHGLQGVNGLHVFTRTSPARRRRRLLPTGNVTATEVGGEVHGAGLTTQADLEYHTDKHQGHYF